MSRNRISLKQQKGSGIRRKRMIRKQETIAYFFLAPSLSGVSVFVLIPFMGAIKRSFTEAMSGIFVGLNNYINVFRNEAFLRAARNTLRFTLTCIPLLLALSLIFAVIVYGFGKTSDFFRTIFLVPMAIPVASIVLIWKLFFHQNGLINVMLSHLGIEAIDFMNSDTAFYVLVFTYIWKNIGYDMVLWTAGLEGIPESYYEAARVDGAGALVNFFYITLPSLKPTFYITAVLSLVNSFKVFREAYLIAGSYPHESIYMLQHLFNNWFVALDIQKMCAAAVVMACVIVMLVLLMQRIGGDDRNV